jgi:6-pyruvoyl-tetrahydropterin synthase
MLTRQQINEHYSIAGIKKNIIRVSSDNGNFRAGNGDFSSWYKKEEGKKVKWCLANDADYNEMARCFRSFYWTLNVFESDIFDVDYNTVKKEESAGVSRKYTVGYTFGVDIDTEHGADIHDPSVKKAVEDIAQYFSDRLREHVPNSVYCLYSGGGIYVMVHHNVFIPFYDRFKNDPKEPWDKMARVLGDAFDYLIGYIKEEFFKLHPEHVGKVKADELNNSQRVFKTLFSIHRKLDYAVIPLNPENIKIDFEKASIPLKPEVIKLGDKWYTEYDQGGSFLSGLLKPFLEQAYKKINTTYRTEGHREFNCSSIPIENIDKWPPCMRNLYMLPIYREGVTRALAAFASFLGQIGIEENQARAMFDELADRWEARTENIFSDYFRIMKVPTCRRLVSDDNRGFPKGVSIKLLGICTPDLRCLNVPSPYYYADKAGNKKRLLTPLSEKPA